MAQHHELPKVHLIAALPHEAPTPAAHPHGVPTRPLLRAEVPTPQDRTAPLQALMVVALVAVAPLTAVEVRVDPGVVIAPRQVQEAVLVGDPEVPAAVAADEGK